MRLPGLEIEARPNYWPSFCKAFPQLNRQLGNSRAITQTFPLEFARVKPQCLIVSTQVGSRMRESCTYGSVRGGGRGNEATGRPAHHPLVSIAFSRAAGLNVSLGVNVAHEFGVNSREGFRWSRPPCMMIPKPSTPALRTRARHGIRLRVDWHPVNAGIGLCVLG